MLSVCRTHRAGSSPNYFHPRDRASSSQRCQWIYLSLSLVRTPSFSPSPPCLAVRASPPLHAALPTAMTVPHPALFSWHFPNPFSTALSFLLLLPLSSPLLPLPLHRVRPPSLRCLALLLPRLLSRRRPHSKTEGKKLSRSRPHRSVLPNAPLARCGCAGEARKRVRKGEQRRGQPKKCRAGGRCGPDRGEGRV